MTFSPQPQAAKTSNRKTAACIFAYIIILILVGCTFVKPVAYVQPTATPNKYNGYVAAIFSGDGQGFGLGVFNMESKIDYLMPFFKRSFGLKSHPDEVRVIEVPPGEYQITYWNTYDHLDNHQFNKTDLPDPAKFAFTVKPGRMTFIGHFKANQAGVDNYTSTTITWRVTPIPTTKEKALALIKKSYDKFSIDSIDFSKFY